ncbi:MAG: hormogonium polysaccharide biosynthesis glycosyltransferase HpsE [Cyanobacteriota bacterium]|nr:hormogonium polysaccharide biosynthesis glycosyltransferase HpsE [Cyanobacteriota bacterium]
MRNINFTVAICTYNGAKRLPKVLDHLKAQIQTEQLNWEIVIVDNNSTDDTAKLIRSYQNSWSSPCPLRYSFEPQQGLAFARQRAIQEAGGEFVVFLDDDNFPAPDWLAQAYSFGQTHPQAGAFGGQIHGDFEVEPPREIKTVVNYYLAIVERGSKPCQYKKGGVLPPGAGLVVRKQAWVENVPEQIFLTGRVGQSLMASEDLEVQSYIQQGGWEIWYNPEMHMDHQISRHRLTRDYLIKIVRGNGLARHHIRMIRLKTWQRPLAFPAYTVKDLGEFVVQSIKHRNVLDTNIEAACKLEHLKATLMSPFFISKKYISEAMGRLNNSQKSKSGSSQNAISSY